MRNLEPMFRRRVAATFGVIAIVFLSSQILGIAHAAQYGDPSHHHDEMPCAVQFAVDTARSLVAPATPPEYTPPIAAIVEPMQFIRRVYLASDITNRPIRGPPSFLF